jgi:hypothetical protein
MPALKPGRGHGDLGKIELVLLPKGAKGRCRGTEHLLDGVAPLKFIGKGRLQSPLLSPCREEGQGFR